MARDEKIMTAIYKAVDEVNQQLESDQQLEKSEETVLFGASGSLDSLGLVKFIVSTEQNLEEELDVSITLADQRAMSQKNSPFRTIGTLADYASTLLKECVNG